VNGISDIGHRLKNLSIFEKKDNKYLCIVKYNSYVKPYWQFVISAVYIVSLWLIPMNICTQFMNYDDNQGLEIAIDFFCLIDIILNLISESVKDVKVNIFLREEARYYFLTFFVFDMLPLVSLLSWET